jgi:GNAT superfamily N-acetyltransferase
MTSDIYQHMTFTFHNDQPNEFLQILREVAQWLVDIDKELWAVDSLTATNLFDDYTRDNCYVLRADRGNGGAASQPGELAGAFILQWKDPIYYADVPDNTAGLLHKVAIRRLFAGQDLFRPMLDFCRAKCLERNVHEIQLETIAIPALMRFYEGYGFQPTRRRVIEKFGQHFDCQFYVKQL